ncbi:type B 50S ribosomal protein L31 [Pseudoalteromonas aliena]|uniref:type B 50S ribosomal protein L31 n=1 Tax=Pseudoalteromonas aliena TaxID=247523 RepID=UPI0031203BAF
MNTSNIHPDYHMVAFHGTAADSYFIVVSTIKISHTVKIDGNIYPYVPIDESSNSYPFYTGKQKTIAKDGSVGQFNRRFKGLSTVKKEKV